MGIQRKEGERGKNAGQEDHANLLSLETIVANQVNRYIELGFHKEVYPDLEEDKAKERYRRDFVFPKGVSQPKEYIGRFDVVLAVEPRISLKKQHELAKRIKELDPKNVDAKWATSQVAEWIDTSKIANLTGFPNDKPYLVFTHDGRKYSFDSVEKARQLFASDEVGSPQIEVTSLYLNHPEYFVGRGINAAGSSRGPVLAPYLDASFLGRPYASQEPIGNQYPHWGVLSRGKDFIPLGA